LAGSDVSNVRTNFKFQDSKRDIVKSNKIVSRKESVFTQDTLTFDFFMSIFVLPL